MVGNLEAVNEEKDVGVIISNDLKVLKQCISDSNKANQKLGYI